MLKIFAYLDQGVPRVIYGQAFYEVEGVGHASGGNAKLHINIFPKFQSNTYVRNYPDKSMKN